MKALQRLMFWKRRENLLAKRIYDLEEDKKNLIVNNYQIRSDARFILSKLESYAGRLRRLEGTPVDYVQIADGIDDALKFISKHVGVDVPYEETKLARSILQERAKTYAKCND